MQKRILKLCWRKRNWILQIKIINKWLNFYKDFYIILFYNDDVWKLFGWNLRRSSFFFLLKLWFFLVWNNVFFLRLCFLLLNFSFLLLRKFLHCLNFYSEHNFLCPFLLRTCFVDSDFQQYARSAKKFLTSYPFQLENLRSYSSFFHFFHMFNTVFHFFLDKCI